MNWSIMPNLVLRECARICSEEQWREIKKEMNKRKLKLTKPTEFGLIEVNDIYFIAKKLGKKVKKDDFTKIANYVQKELNK